MTEPVPVARRAVAIAALATVLITPLEGTGLVAVHQKFDPIGVITWCTGRTNYDDPTVQVGTRFTKAQCVQFLQDDIPKYQKPLEGCVHVDLTNHNWAALDSASYNTGPKAVCNSPMVKAFNAHDPKACDKFVGWHVAAAGVRLKGLVNRRIAESKFCRTKD
jgi:lysozyme